MVIMTKLKARSRESSPRFCSPHACYCVVGKSTNSVSHMHTQHTRNWTSYSTHIDRDLRITCTTSLLKNHSVKDWLDLLGNLGRRKDVFLLRKKKKKKNGRSNLVILIRNNFIKHYIIAKYIKAIFK